MPQDQYYTLKVLQICSLALNSERRITIRNFILFYRSNIRIYSLSFVSKNIKSFLRKILNVIGTKQLVRVLRIVRKSGANWSREGSFPNVNQGLLPLIIIKFVESMGKSIVRTLQFYNRGIQEWVWAESILNDSAVL